MSVTFQRTGMTYTTVIEEDDGYAYAEPDGPSLNVSNANADFLLGLLGLSLAPDYCGSMSGEDLLGRVLLAQAINPTDAGVPARELQPGEDFALFGPVREGGPTFIDCGRREGYADERLTILREIAEDAIAHGQEVFWG